GPPPTAEFVFPEVTANPFAIEVSKAVLGKDCYLTFYNGNTNCPGSEYQQVHLDNPHLWRGDPRVSPTYSLVINISPQDCTLENGAVEVWPGTHMINAPVDLNNVLQEVLDKRRRERPPIQAETNKGDILIRDARLWHRGVPNNADEPRHMIAFVYIAGWHQRQRTIPFEKGCEKVLEGVDFDFNAAFTDEPIDYLLGPTKRAYKLGINRD
ncbi:MAG TPA: phytanoyl-CoA dioxygenase family protein, partial [Pseudomonadales bacterium]|nr:phytanoyl-CoA dioxygenase family protein [Pseudomonadales bacterium]